MCLLTFEFAETSTLHICIPRSFKPREETSALPMCIPRSLSYKAKTNALDIEFYTENTLYTHLHHYFYCLERSYYIVERYNLASYADVSPSMKICAQRRAKGESGRVALRLSFFSFPCSESSLALRHQFLAYHSPFSLASVRKRST